MNPLPLSILMFLAVGMVEWWLALRRVLACSRGEKTMLVSIVFIENLVCLFVLKAFVVSNDWKVAIAYAIGGALGALCIAGKLDKPDTSDKK